MDSKERNWDLSVPSVRDIEAPLGGTSTVYEIVLVEGDEQFTYTKTFREIEDFARKLQKKFTAEPFPVLYNGTDVELKRQAAQTLFQFVAKKPGVISSSITQQFMGQDRSIKHIVKDRNQNPTAPPATVKQDLFDDLFKESEFLSNNKQSNLFDDDSCELFSSKPEKVSQQKSEDTVTPKKSELHQSTATATESKPFGVSKQLNDTESESDETDQLFVPRKSSLIQPDDLCEETEDLFRVDDNLNDLLMTVSARAEAAKAKTSGSGQVKNSTTPPSVQPTQVRTPAAKVCEPIVKPAVPSKPSIPAKPTADRPPKPVPKPKPAHLQNKPTASSVRPAATTSASDPDMNPADISSYIAAAEKDSQRQVSLFDE